MRLTIIPSDQAVYKDGVVYSPLNTSAVPADVHALQWFSVEGWIEFNDGKDNQQITELPAWAYVCLQEWEAADYEHKNPPPPPPPTANDNKNMAVGLLAETDWTALPDIADPLKSNPYLANTNEFNAYRNAVRKIAINPIAGDIDWPQPPQEVWTQV